MIKSLIVQNYVGDEIEIILAEDEPDHGLLLESITGLGPVKADINLMELVTTDGSIYNTARIGERNIVIKFIFTDDIEATRHLTYKYFPQKKWVDLIVKTDYRILMTRGYVESNEPEIFSANEGCSISLICPDPFLYTMNNNSVTASDVIKLFEFPFEADEGIHFAHDPILDYKGESVLDYRSEEIMDTRMTRLYNFEPIEFGEALETPEARVENEGNVEIGVILTFKFSGPAGDLVVYNAGSKQRMEINISKIGQVHNITVGAGDRISVNTRFGQKSATFRHGENYYNILYCLEEDPDWIHLVGGRNVFTYSSAFNQENVEFTVVSANAYDGI